MNIINKQQGTDIQYIHFDEQSDDAIYDGDTIYIPVTRTAYENGFRLKLDSLIVSDYAKVDKQVGQTLDYSEPVRYRLYSEQGRYKSYLIIAVYTKADGNALTNLLLEGQVGRASVVGDTAYVNVKRAYVLTGLDLKLTRMIMSDRASVVPAEGTISNYFAPVNYRITSESGKNKTYTVVVREALEDSAQVNNNSFDEWFDRSVYSVSRARNSSYVLPGKSPDQGGANQQRWACYNDGMAQTNVGTTAVGKTDGFRSAENSQVGRNYAARLVTHPLWPLVDLPVSSVLPYRGLVPGMVFTGQIINITNEPLNSQNITDFWTGVGVKIVDFFTGKSSNNAAEVTSNIGVKREFPPSAADFKANSLYGIAFNSMPSSITFDYKYTPSGKDQMDAFVILENRSLDGLTVKRLGVAWLRGDAQGSWKTIELPVFYAVNNQVPMGYFPYSKNKGLPFTATDPNFLLPNQPKWTWGDVRKEPITDVIVVFSSSAHLLTDPNNANGYSGSTLMVDNLKFNYGHPIAVAKP